VHEIVLVTRAYSIVSDFFNGKQLSKSINPNELGALACGAAILAAIIDGNPSSKTDQVLLLDVTDHWRYHDAAPKSATPFSP
jgi:heat shock protein 1/8